VRWDEEEEAMVEMEPGNGKGVVARRLIRKGEAIMVGHPIVIGRMRFTKAVNPEQGRKLVAEAVERLSKESKEEVLALARSSGSEVAVEDVLKTNIFGIEVGGSKHCGLFPSLSVSLKVSAGHEGCYG
jgi:hypothetical protein